MNHYHYAWYLGMFGRVEEAVAEHRRAQELDPLTPFHTTWLPALYLFSEDYERALPLARENVKRYDPGIIAHYVLGETLARMGRYEEAIAVHEKLAATAPVWSHALGLTYARAGRTEDARRILRQLEAQPPGSWVAYGLAGMHAALGNRGEALHWLEYEPAHAWLAAAAAWWPEFEPYRDDPRFQAILRRMNLQLVPGAPAPVALPMVAPPLSGIASPG